MNELTQIGFDYAALPVDAALNARAAAERIKIRLKRTGEDIIEIGRELKEVKPSLEGRFDAWFESETGLDRQMAYKFIRATERFGEGAYNNYTSLSPTVIYLLSAPSTPESVIDKAVAKTESGEKVTVADVKDWKAELEAEKRRAEEFRVESNERRKTIRALEQQIDLLQAQPAPEPEIKEVIPADYETAKAKAAELETELATVKAEQTRIIQSAIKAKLQGYQGEVDALETKKRTLEKQAKEYQDYLASLAENEKQMEAQTRSIEKSRQALLDLADELAEYHPVNEKINRRWLALIEMHRAATDSMSLVFGPSRPALSVVRDGT